MHFPPKAKLFIHRVGRVARAGRSGTAISLVSADELAYLSDLFLFLGKPIRFATDSDEYDGNLLWHFFLNLLWYIVCCNCSLSSFTQFSENFYVCVISVIVIVMYIYVDHCLESVTLIGKVPDAVVGLESEFLHSAHNSEDMVSFFFTFAP